MREFRTSGSVGALGGQLPRATQPIVDQFDVIVNTRPFIAVPLPDIILVRSGTDTVSSPTEALSTNGGDQAAQYALSRYFDVEMSDVAGTSVVFEDDTTCSFSTSPAQPTGRPYDVARTAAVGPVASDPVKATSLASVSAFEDATTETWAMLKGAAPRVVINSAAEATTPLEATSPPTSAAAAGTGKFTLTITCSDQDRTISDSATITVRQS